MSSLGSSGRRVQGAFPLPGSCHHKVVTHCAFVSVLLVAGNPVKWFLGKKNQRAEVAQEGKENASAALGLGRISADLRAGHGATPQPGQQLSCPGDLLCCVLRFPVCANGCVYRCKVGAGGIV